MEEAYQELSMLSKDLVDISSSSGQSFSH